MKLEDVTSKNPKKRHTWLWVLGWICIFPLPLTILLVRKRDMNAIAKYGIIVIAWVFYLIIAFSGRNKNDTDQVSVSESEEVTVSDKPTIPEETTSKGDVVADLIVDSEEEQYKTENNSEPIPETEIEENVEKGIRNEGLKGRGRADSGRSEPNYRNVIGYAVVSSSQENEIKRTDDFENMDLWIVPTYEQDKQFWNETGITLPHKTEVVVKEQYLEHEGYGGYSGYLLVERTDDGQQCYIDVDTFITKPYWNYETDLREAALTGSFVAEYHQISNYYPVDNSGDKVELEDGIHVLVTGVAGTSRDVNPSETGIDAVVWKEWRLGYGDVTVHFNEGDLSIIY